MNIQEISRNIVARIRSRNRDQWAALCREGLTELRIWVQEHGEKAAILGFVLGLLITLAFKLFVGLIVIGVLVGYLVWYLAPAATQPATQPRSFAESRTAPTEQGNTAHGSSEQSSTEHNGHVQ